MLQDGQGGSSNKVLDYVASIPDTLEYKGEFGAELILFLPFVNWLSRTGLLGSRRIITYRGMKCFYDDLKALEVVEQSGVRVARQPKNRLPCLPAKDEHTLGRFGPCAFHIYPDLRRKFAALPLQSRVAASDRPLLVIHNKFNSEWNSGPINFIDPATLETIFSTLKHQFQIIYIRHGAGQRNVAYSQDVDGQMDLGDLEVLERHHEVLSFDALFAEHVAGGGQDDINTFKNKIYSRCFYFLSVQGGGCHHIAYFRGSLMVILHKRGHESKYAYSEGYYNFLANPAPIRAICADSDELMRAAALFTESCVIGDRVHLSDKARQIIRPFLPKVNMTGKKIV
ncbi:hypothetical protein [Sediminicoccus rosea]|jgi:hypothetical protein|uniref:Capsular polysaccharide biosynthesis protein n=1 Tax=Sediminicoccus rosea TaxID=1225128 RepID=A0ABZ0PHC4_9PROT|nr:hypothetical protein [Sediminicoccus rosea]WPB84743.1 hypothetical protein R9Z33_21950 [Sediminicoccus rosea]